MPNPESSERMSPVIAFQVAQAHLETSLVSDSRLETLTEQACEIGQEVLSEARKFAPLEPYASRFVSYETRVNANLVDERSPLWPQNVPVGYLHAPHEDRSVATVGINATAEGFGYYDFDTRRFTQELPKNYAFLGKDNGLGAKACLRAVERGASSGRALECKTVFCVGWVSVVVFLQGPTFATRTTAT